MWFYEDTQVNINRCEFKQGILGPVYEGKKPLDTMRYLCYVQYLLESQDSHTPQSLP